MENRNRKKTASGMGTAGRDSLGSHTGNDMDIAVWYTLAVASVVGLLLFGILIYSCVKICAYNRDLKENEQEMEQDNSYYLRHSFMDRENRAGCIFMDYRNASFEDKNVVIYGHNITDGSMFGSLKEVLEDRFWEEKESSHLLWRSGDEEKAGHTCEGSGNLKCIVKRNRYIFHFVIC